MKRSQLKHKLTRQVIPNFLNRYVCELLFLNLQLPSVFLASTPRFFSKITLAAVFVTFIFLRGAVLSV